MKSSTTTVLVAAGILTITAGMAGSVVAATYTPHFAGSVVSSVANCPSIAWRIGQSPDGSLHGMMWYTDMSGTSEVNGSETGSGGQFTLTLKSVMGEGPVGTVQGQKGKGATLTGPGCANATFKPMVVTSYGGGG
jgi:hypothetical protein